MQQRLYFEQLIDRPELKKLSIILLTGNSHQAIAACDAALVASGTATLEVALFKKPMVIAYRVAWLSYQLMRHMAYLPWIGLPNILLNESVVPEFVQHAATPQALAEAIIAQLHDAPGRAQLAERFAGLHQDLRRNTGERAAEAIFALMERGA